MNNIISMLVIVGAQKMFQFGMNYMCLGNIYIVLQGQGFPSKLVTKIYFIPTGHIFYASRNHGTNFVIV